MDCSLSSRSPVPRSRPGCLPTAPSQRPRCWTFTSSASAASIAELRSYRVVLADTAREEAAAAQARLDAGERLPLLGVPIAIKDDVDVAGEVTTYGTAAHGPARSAGREVVRRLRDAGAVIIGKTTVPEMMLWSFTETLDVRCDAQSVEHRLHAGRQQRRQRRGGGRGSGARWRWAPTGWGRSGSRRRGAGCSGSSRSGTGYRWRRMTTRGTG